MDPKPTDIKLDMLRSKTSYWYNEMYVNINIAFGIIRWKILKQNPTDITIIWCKLTKSYWYLSSIYKRKLSVRAFIYVR